MKEANPLGAPTVGLFEELPLSVLLKDGRELSTGTNSNGCCFGFCSVVWILNERDTGNPESKIEEGPLHQVSLKVFKMIEGCHER